MPGRKRVHGRETDEETEHENIKYDLSSFFFSKKTK